MFIGRVFVIFMVGIMVSGAAMGQQDGFCDAIAVIMRDAPNKFRNIRGKLIEANANATLWDCGIKVPGILKSRFVGGIGLFYEGAFLQTKHKEDVQNVYDTYRELLDSCLYAQGYKRSMHDNFYPGMEGYKKLVYMQDLKEDEMPEKPPVHIALEATYSKDLGLYTVVMYIFEH